MFFEPSRRNSSWPPRTSTFGSRSPCSTSTGKVNAGKSRPTRRSEGQIAEIAKFLQMLRDATERRSHREDADFSFHLAITHAANNQYFETSMRALKDHIAVGMKFHGLSLQTLRGGLDHVFEEHTAIFEAIRLGQAETAREAMQRHVGGSRDRLFEGRQLDLSSR